MRVFIYLIPKKSKGKIIDQHDRNKKETKTKEFCIYKYHIKPKKNTELNIPTTLNANKIYKRKIAHK